MKRVFVFLLVAMLVSASVFAVDFSVGLASGYEQDILISEVDFPTFHQVPVKAVATIDILDNFAVGIDLGMGINFADSLPETKVGFVADIAAYYRLALSDSFALYLGGGLGYDLISFDVEGIVSSFHTMDLFADVKASYDVMDNLSIFGGAKFGMDIFKIQKISMAGSSSSLNVLKESDGTGIQWGLSVGAAYKF